MSWTYRRPITITPATPKANFQVKVTLTLANFDYSNCNVDGSDIRFKDTSINALDYWIESWDNTGNSIIWVEVTTISTSSIWIYYGNASASSESSGDDTFDFFDDFESRDIGEVPDPAKWNITENGNQIRIAANPDDAGNKVLKLYQPGIAGEETLYYDINKTFAKNEYIIQHKFRPDTTANQHIKHRMYAMEDATVCITILASEIINGYKFQWYDDVAYQNYVAHLTIQEDIWHSLIDYIGLASYIRRKSPDDYTGGFRNAIITGINLFKFEQYHDIDVVANYVDNVIVRQYAYPELGSSVGAEEDAPAESDYHIALPIAPKDAKDFENKYHQASTLDPHYYIAGNKLVGLGCSPSAHYKIYYIREPNSLLNTPFDFELNKAFEECLLDYAEYLALKLENDRKTAALCLVDFRNKVRTINNNYLESFN